jgi:hypothetical protein
MRAVASEASCDASRIWPLYLQPGQPVLYLGDWDHCGHQIEEGTKRTLAEHTGTDRPWERAR